MCPTFVCVSKMENNIERCVVYIAISIVTREEVVTYYTTYNVLLTYFKTFFSVIFQVFPPYCALTKIASGN